MGIVYILSYRNSQNMEGVNTFQGAEVEQKETETEYSVKNDRADEVIDTKESKSEMCRFFLQNECRFGDKCRNRHVGKPVEKVSPKNKRIPRKQDDTRCVENTKKPPMKTAEDVIKRLQWDPMLPKVRFHNDIFCRFKG